MTVIPKFDTLFFLVRCFVSAWPVHDELVEYHKELTNMSSLITWTTSGDRYWLVCFVSEY